MGGPIANFWCVGTGSTVIFSKKFLFLEKFSLFERNFMIFYRKTAQKIKI
jgi:hypothetical protein